jgi:hypothetical protein
MTESASSLVALLDRHLEAFNHGVRTGDFARMLAMYETDAVFELAAPVSATHEGLAAIRGAYRDNPPNDTMRLGEPAVNGRSIEADYWWDAEPDRRAGRLYVEFRGDRVVRKRVTFARSSG